MPPKKILLIGGGTGGHILPLKNLSEALKTKGAQVEIIVADTPLDRAIVKKNFSKTKQVHYFKTGKIRRYLSLQNFIDFFKIIHSILNARKILKAKQPDVIFFKGGFVGFPFFMAAKYLMKYPGKIYSHESDIIPGLLTRIVSKKADHLFESFGNPPRPLFYTPSTNTKNKKSPHRPSNAKTKKRILIFGASQGAQFINETFLANAEPLCKKYIVTLISGVGKEINFKHQNYKSFTLLSAKELTQKIKTADLVISRAGSSSLFEIITAKKPSIIIPLPSAAQNHQTKNAQYFEKKGLCILLPQSSQTKKHFISTIEKTLNNQALKKALQQTNIKNSAEIIAQQII